MLEALQGLMVDVAGKMMRCWEWEKEMWEDMEKCSVGVGVGGGYLKTFTISQTLISNYIYDVEYTLF